MSSDTKYTPAEYIKYVEMDDSSYHLLVEGRDDEKAFDTLIGTLVSEPEQNTIALHSAETLACGDPENRGIVEGLCAQITEKTWASRFVGFVDREFRGFVHDPIPRDIIGGHYICGRLVWSRGHSIENYLFDPTILSQPLATFSPPGCRQAVRLFKSVFDPTIRLACAIGLAACDIDRLKRVRKTIEPRIVLVRESVVEADIASWKSLLLQRITEVEVESLLERIGHWQVQISQADFDVVRWLCDGHIGFRLIWAVYEKCLNMATLNLPPSRDVLRYNRCVDSWVDSAANKQSTYPAEVFALLGC